MSERWAITIDVWPYSTGAGQQADQERAGERRQHFYVDADSIRDAIKMADCCAEGIKRNPAVWQARIAGVYLKALNEAPGVEAAQP